METLHDERLLAPSYHPSSLLTIFANVLNAEPTRKEFRITGIYQEGKGISYGGLYYDTLKDESTDTTLTLVVPGKLRTFLQPQQTIECLAYLIKKIQPNGGRIELQVAVTSIISQVEAKYTDKQLRAFEILQQKADVGYRDVDSFIKTKIIAGEQLTITILIGRSGIIDSDIKHQLQEAIGFYTFNFIRINLSLESEIIAAINTYHETDILIVARGGGENLNIFDSPDIAEASLAIRPYFVTAIGHKENSPLLQKVADKSFITPTALGQYFNDIYNETIAQLQDSKAKLVEDITNQLEAGYTKQLANLSEKLQNTEELHAKAMDNSAAIFQKEVTVLKAQITLLTDAHAEQLMQLREIHEEKFKFANEQLLHAKQSMPKPQPTLITWLFIIAALILGLVLGKGCN